MKATKVDGVYSADPEKDKNARLMRRLSYHEVLSRGLRVMDAAAISLCQETGTPIQIFNINRTGLLKKAVLGEDVGSLIVPDQGSSR